MSTATELTITTVPLQAIELDPANVRIHDARNIKAIADSLTTFGQRKPIVVMRAGQDRYVVIAGNGTLEAARQIGWTELAIAIAPEGWTSDDAAAYAIADNRTSELAGWDEPGLRAQLADLASSGWDLGLLGFDAIGGIGEELIEIVEDTPPEPPLEPITKPGDLWILGEHRVLCGDATSREDTARLMAGRTADLIFTDPPYGIAYVGKTADALTITNDRLDPEEFRRFLRAAYERMAEATRPGAAIYVCHSDAHGSAFREELTRAGFLHKQTLVWIKNHFVLGRQDYQWQHEPILYGWRDGGPHTWTGPRNRVTVIDDAADPEAMKKAELLAIVRELYEVSSAIREDRPPRSTEHPTMKPVRLVARLTVNNTHRGDLVLDPFLGSGSTLIAAEQLGRTCYGLEIDPAYADVVVTRWERFTGRKAERDG